MKNAKILDTVLAHLAANNRAFAPVFDHFLPDNLKNQLPVLLDKLVKDGFAVAKEIPHPEINPAYGKTIEVYKITSSGLAFNQESSYSKKEKKDKRQKFWTKTKTIAVAVNGIILLTLAIWNFNIQYKASVEKTKTSREIDSLKTVISQLQKEKPAIVNTAKTLPDSTK